MIWCTTTYQKTHFEIKIKNLKICHWNEGTAEVEIMIKFLWWNLKCHHPYLSHILVTHISFQEKVLINFNICGNSSCTLLLLIMYEMTSRNYCQLDMAFILESISNKEPKLVTRDFWWFVLDKYLLRFMVCALHIYDIAGIGHLYWT